MAFLSSTQHAFHIYIVLSSCFSFVNHDFRFSLSLSLSLMHLSNYSWRRPPKPFPDPPICIIIPNVQIHFSLSLSLSLSALSVPLAFLYCGADRHIAVSSLVSYGSNVLHLAVSSLHFVSPFSLYFFTVFYFFIHRILLFCLMLVLSSIFCAFFYISSSSSSTIAVSLHCITTTIGSKCFGTNSYNCFVEVADKSLIANV